MFLGKIDVQRMHELLASKNDVRGATDKAQGQWKRMEKVTSVVKRMAWKHQKVLADQRIDERR